jgi:hypothetical protein
MKTTMVLVSLLLFGQSVVAADFRALLVGVNANDATKEPLKCPFNRDAVVMHKLFQKQGVQSKLLFGEEATYAKVYKELDRMVKKSKEGDINFILFSTHGGVEHGDYTAYLYDEETISGKEIIEITGRMKGIVIIAVDTCHAGMLLRHKTPDNVVIFAACKEMQGAGWVPLRKLSDNEPCGYLTRPLFKAFSSQQKKLAISEVVREVMSESIPDPPLLRLGGDMNGWSEKGQNPIYRVPPKLMQVSLR